MLIPEIKKSNEPLCKWKVPSVWQQYTCQSSENHFLSSSLDCHISQFYSSLLVFDHLLHIPTGESYAHLPVSYLQCLMSICTFYQGFQLTSARINWAILSLASYMQAFCSSRRQEVIRVFILWVDSHTVIFLKDIFAIFFISAGSEDLVYTGFCVTV